MRNSQVNEIVSAGQSAGGFTFLDPWGLLPMSADGRLLAEHYHDFLHFTPTAYATLATAVGTAGAALLRKR